MFKKDQPMASSSNGNETIIAQGVKVEGDFQSQGDVVIDGEVSGSVKTASSLRVGETAVIHADVRAASAVVAGTIQGNLHAADGIELLATSVVEGDIQTGSISVAQGARINGRVSMNGTAAPVVEEGDDEE